MNSSFLLTGCFLGALFSASCDRPEDVQKLPIGERNTFASLKLTKVFEIDLYGRWCLPCAGGVVCCEILDRQNREYRFMLFDYSGVRLKERRVLAGQGPDEIQGGNMNTVWLSSSGKIRLLDVGDYLKEMNPETLEIETIVKLSNVVAGYGSRYTTGRVSGSSVEEKDGRIVTCFESAGFPEDFTYYVIACSDALFDLSVVAEEKKEKPPSWKRLEESRQKGGLRETLIDYYERLRLERNIAVDWKRDAAYIIPEIERPRIERIGLRDRQKKIYKIDVTFEEFAIDRKEFDAFAAYASSETPEIVKQNVRSTLYIPWHAPALMRTIVVGDRLLIITGNRNWTAGQNEVIVYRLPSLDYEGTFLSHSQTA